MIICRNCGNFMEETEAVCPACGAARGEESPAPPIDGQETPQPEGQGFPAQPPQDAWQGQPPVYGNPYVPGVPYKKKNALATAGFICSLLGLTTCGVTALIGVILSVLGRRQIEERDEGGRELASAGIGIGIAILALYAVVILLTLVSAIMKYA